MNFTHYDLGHLTGGQIVLVTLDGTEANVCLMDSSNFQTYKSGRGGYRYFGGHTKRSPVKLYVPSSGYWHVTVDLGGFGGNVRSSIQLLPGALPPIQEASLDSLPSLVRNRPPATGLLGNEASRNFDVFISHASEDKDEIVRPLASALREGGLDVWYDEFELKIGDSLRRKIDAGLARSRFGVVVMSKEFFRKGWTNYELDGIVTKVVTGEQILLPIWHNISKQEVIDYSPSLADKLARSTATHTVKEIAAEIISVIKAT